MIHHIFISNIFFSLGEVKSGLMKNNDFPISQVMIWGPVVNPPVYLRHVSVHTCFVVVFHILINQLPISCLQSIYYLSTWVTTKSELHHFLFWSPTIHTSRVLASTCRHEQKSAKCRQTNQEGVHHHSSVQLHKGWAGVTPSWRETTWR